MSLFAVVKYYNYRKHMDFEVLATFTDMDECYNSARDLAIKEFGFDIHSDFGEEGNKLSFVNEVIGIFTRSDGWDQYVFAAIEIPSPRQ